MEAGGKAGYAERCRDALSCGDHFKFKAVLAAWRHREGDAEGNAPYRGVLSFLNGDYYSAITLLGTGVIPPDISIYLVLSYVSLGKYDIALEKLEDMRKRAGRSGSDGRLSATLFIIEAFIYFMKGERDQARSMVRSALSSDLEHSIGYLKKAIEAMQDERAKFFFRELLIDSL